ncbi:hypothetical protein SAMN04490187_0377 [Pseudomonas jessenii]|uniref:Uncharacterized protein n=2 Tax=Pseudomonas TaxID=286 RepID=A0A1H4JNE4_PSEJE|nr:hypothetical protein SAMN04490187_0377 [Pseudomonas jessenii]VVP87364.1 hypothetical protein PS922_02369 [Pseudomonas fluorescens]
MWRGGLPPLGRVATPKPAFPMHQMHRMQWFYDCYAAERGQAPRHKSSPSQEGEPSAYFAAQELKRCSSCSPLSAQKLTSICTWLAMFSGVVGMSFRTSLASSGTAWVLAGP